LIVAVEFVKPSITWDFLLCRTKYNLRSAGYASAEWTNRKVFPDEVNNIPSYTNYSGE